MRRNFSNSTDPTPGCSRRTRQLRLAEGSNQEAEGCGRPEWNRRLRGIRAAGSDGIEIGAMTTLTEVVNHPIVKQKYDLLAQAAELVASPQIRNQGTIGGNVSQDTRCWYYRSGWPCYRAGATSAMPTRRRAATASMRFCRPTLRGGESSIQPQP